jgi:hemerythrin-like domain-containing protein
VDKIFEQILGELKDIKNGQDRLKSFRSSIVKDLTPYIESVEKHIEGSKDEIHERFDRLDRCV